MLKKGKRLTGSSGGPGLSGRPTEGANRSLTRRPDGHRGPGVTKSGFPKMNCAA